MGSPYVPTPDLGGWTRSQLIELADRRTERRGSKTLDLNSEFILALQHLCGESRWAWRRKTAAIMMRAGIWQYDISRQGEYVPASAYLSQPTWQITAAVRASGQVKITLPSGLATVPDVDPGEDIFVLSASDPSFNGPIAVSAGGGGNLVTNGDFEQGATGWNLGPAGSIVSDPVISHGGGKCLQISSSAHQVVQSLNPISVYQGLIYRISGWVKILNYSGNNVVDINVIQQDIFGAPVATLGFNADTTIIGMWQYVTGTFTPDPACVTIVPYLQINQPGGGTSGPVTALFDDLVYYTQIVGAQAGADATIAPGTILDVVGVQPFPTLIGADAIDFQQFAKHGVKFYPNGNPSQPAELTPLFERGLQTIAIYANGNNPQPQQPRQYFMMPGQFLVLAVTPVPDRDYPLTLDYWAMPNVRPDSMPEAIPLVPAYLHTALLKRLEAQIFRYTLGEGAAKYQAAMGEYESIIDRFQGMDGMVSGEHSDYSEDDDYASTFANAQNAVQSTV